MIYVTLCVRIVQDSVNKTWKETAKSCLMIFKVFGIWSWSRWIMLMSRSRNCKDIVTMDGRWDRTNFHGNYQFDRFDSPTRNPLKFTIRWNCRIDVLLNPLTTSFINHHSKCRRSQESNQIWNWQSDVKSSARNWWKWRKLWKTRWQRIQSQSKTCKISLVRPCFDCLQCITLVRLSKQV